MSMLDMDRGLTEGITFDDNQAQIFKGVLTDLEDSEFSDVPDAMDGHHPDDDTAPFFESADIDAICYQQITSPIIKDGSEKNSESYKLPFDPFNNGTEKSDHIPIDKIEHEDFVDSRSLNKTNGRPASATELSNGLQYHIAELKYKKALSTDVNGSLKRKRGRPRKTEANGSGPQSLPIHKPPHKVSDIGTSGPMSPLIAGDGSEFRPRSSIPQDMSWPQFARQGIVAAGGARLNPYALHPAEYQLLKAHITKTQVTVYLNIRNSICRLWHQNPLVPVTRQEAAGCARSSRYFQLAQVAYDWLLRNGHINFGCVDVGEDDLLQTPAKKCKRPSVAVIGAGVSGLSCARQLEGLKRQLRDQFAAKGQMLPKIVVLEGRNRIGGRVYSHPFKCQIPGSLPGNLRNTAEMGAMIITGFNHGNPLHYIIRGQLGLRYHTIKDATVLHDVDGSKVDPDHDEKVQTLWNDILDRACVYKSKTPQTYTAMGDEALIRIGEDPIEHWRTESETLDVEVDTDKIVSEANPLLADASTTFHSMTGREKAAGRNYVTGNMATKGSAAQFAKDLGYKLRTGVAPDHTINLDSAATSSKHPTLGDVMEEGFRQYDSMIALSPKELRMLNWHSANLEYGFAASLGDLSLSNFDQDGGNEFEGPHTEIIGGYTQLPRGLWQLPYPLDVRFNHAVKAINRPTAESRDRKIKIESSGNSTIEADHVVLTAPLGVLQKGSIKFNPPLPAWKSACIDRMGFGLLNKIALIYEKPFWEDHRDGWGSLNIPAQHDDEQTGYAQARGQFYYFWNASKTAGRPTLVAISVGPSAEAAESISDHDLISAVTRRLRRMFAQADVPPPSETIISRWRNDPFAGGSYSYVGPRTLQDDYETMAKPVDDIHFSGEGTCGSYPATVHGAYLSGLRAAADVINSLLGPIEIPVPLIPRKGAGKPASAPPVKRNKPGYIDVWEPILPPQAPHSSLNEPDIELETYEARIISSILEELGPQPIKPDKADGTVTNPFLLFTNDHWASTKQACNEERVKSTGNPAATASRHEVRIAIGKIWREESEEVKRPYNEKVEAAKRARAEYVFKTKAWEANALRLRAKFLLDNPPPEHLKSRLEAGALGKKTR